MAPQACLVLSMLQPWSQGSGTHTVHAMMSNIAMQEAEERASLGGWCMLGEIRAAPGGWCMLDEIRRLVHARWCIRKMVHAR